MADTQTTTTRITCITIPEAKSPSRSQARRGARSGWWRHVIRTDKSLKGAYCLIGEEPFLRAGEHELAVGSVLIEADTDKTVRIWVTSRTERRIAWTIDEDGDPEWLALSAKITLCRIIDAALAADELTVWQRDVARQRLRITYHESRTNLSFGAAQRERNLITCRERLAEAQDMIHRLADEASAQPPEPLAELEAKVAKLEAELADARAELAAERDEQRDEQLGEVAR